MQDKRLTGYPSIDKPWMKYYSEEPQYIPRDDATFFDCLYEKNIEHSNDIALVYYGKKFTYGELFSNIQRTRDALLNYGIKSGDKVILFTSSTPETVYIVLALCRIGAVANMINPLFTKEQIIARINETDASLMIVLDQLYEKIADVFDDLCMKTTVVVPVYQSMPKITGEIAKIKLKKPIKYNSQILLWNDFIGQAHNSAPDAEYEKNRPLIMVYSSGTTGASKGIVLTSDGLRSMLIHYSHPNFQYQPFYRGDTMLQMIPVWFSTGIVASLLMPLALGVTVILEPVFSKESFAQDIKKYMPKMTLAATSLWIYAMQCKELQNVDLSGVQCPISGGEHTLPRVEQALNKFLKKHGCCSALLKGYGMCELGSTVTMDSPNNTKIGSAGYPIHGVTLAAFDTVTNQEQKYDERGEIRVNTPCHMKEYFKNPDATNEFFWTDDNGTVWGCTGDMGYVDEDGFVYILGRCSDNFLSLSGEKIYCFDIENLILQNENISQCEVVGMPVDEEHCVPVAQLVVNESTAMSTDELVKKIHSDCTKQLNSDCVPCGYKFVTAFPVKNNGKRDMELIKEDKTNYIIPDEQGNMKTISF